MAQGKEKLQAALGQGLVGGEWFLRVQEGMEGRASLRRDTARIVTGEGMDSLWLMS